MPDRAPDDACTDTLQHPPDTLQHPPDIPLHPPDIPLHPHDIPLHPPDIVLQPPDTPPQQHGDQAHGHDCVAEARLDEVTEHVHHNGCRHDSVARVDSPPPTLQLSSPDVTPPTSPRPSPRPSTSPRPTLPPRPAKQPGGARPKCCQITTETNNNDELSIVKHQLQQCKEKARDDKKQLLELKRIVLSVLDFSQEQGEAFDSLHLQNKETGDHVQDESPKDIDSRVLAITEEQTRTAQALQDRIGDIHKVQRDKAELHQTWWERITSSSGGAGKNASSYGTTGDPSQPPTHCHQRNDEHTTEAMANNKRARRKLIFASVLCLFFMVGEIVGGYLANSLAIATDAAHLLTDFASFMISLFALFLATRPPTKRMSFGWARAEVVGALVSVLLIWVVTGVLVYMAVQRCLDTSTWSIEPNIMMITAGVGVLVNIVMGVSLHDSHTHSHFGGSSHSHGSTPTDSYEGTPHDSHDEDEENQLVKKESHGHSHGININVRAAFIHVVGDLIQSIGVFVAAVIIKINQDWKLADPICTFIFSVLVLITTISILRDTMLVLMEGTPRGIKYNDVRRTLRGIKGVREIHNLRIWSITMSKAAISAHLAIDSTLGHQEVIAVAGTLMRERFGINECTIQIEDYVDEMVDCSQCQEPKD